MKRVIVYYNSVPAMVIKGEGSLRIPFYEYELNDYQNNNWKEEDEEYYVNLYAPKSFKYAVIEKRYMLKKEEE